MAEQQKAQQLMIQQQLQQKLMAKYSGLMESKVQAIQDPVKKELVSQMMGISAPPAAPASVQSSGVQTQLSQMISQYSQPSSGAQNQLSQMISQYSQPSIQNFGTVGTSYKPSSYFPSSSYTGSSASASAGASANNYGAYVPGNTNSASAYADASATSSGGATAWSSASSSAQVVPTNTNTDWSKLFGMFGSMGKK